MSKESNQKLDERLERLEKHMADKNSNVKRLTRDVKDLKESVNRLTHHMEQLKDCTVEEDKQRRIEWALRNCVKVLPSTRLGGPRINTNMIYDILWSFRKGDGHKLPTLEQPQLDGIVNRIHYLTGVKPRVSRDDFIIYYS